MYAKNGIFCTRLTYKSWCSGFRVEYTCFDPDDGVPDELSAMFQVQFVFNAFPVRADGPGADVETAGNFSAGFPFANHLEDFHFTVCQPFQ